MLRHNLSNAKSLTKLKIHLLPVVLLKTNLCPCYLNVPPHTFCPFACRKLVNLLCLIRTVSKTLFLLYLPSVTKSFESFTVLCDRVKYDRDTSRAINANRRGHWSELENAKPCKNKKTIENRNKFRPGTAGKVLKEVNVI